VEINANCQLDLVKSRSHYGTYNGSVRQLYRLRHFFPRSWRIVLRRHAGFGDRGTVGSIDLPCPVGFSKHVQSDPGCGRDCLERSIVCDAPVYNLSPIPGDAGASCTYLTHDQSYSKNIKSETRALAAGQIANAISLKSQTRVLVMCTADYKSS
jgi:hypothetical protein